jgi:hypothetical protein
MTRKLLLTGGLSPALAWLARAAAAPGPDCSHPAWARVCGETATITVPNEPDTHGFMISIQSPSLAELDDDELVARSLAGEVEAFRQIGIRYYPLIRTLAYEPTGSVSQSDSLARDTLVAAWKQLADLPDRAKLRSWLCGIVRNLTNDFLQYRSASPGAGSSPLR